MAKVLFALGGLLIVWGAYVLFTGDFVATLDIAAGLVGSGVGVVALGAIVNSLDRIARQLADRPVSVAAPHPAPERAPPRAPAEPPAPTLVREGVVEGRRYRFFSDGSIEAEGPHGLRRYRSMDEAREDILRGRADHTEGRPPADNPRTPSAPRSPRPAKQSWESYLPPDHRSEDRTPDPYAPARAPGRDESPEDEEWSEPFRMLLKGDVEPPVSPPKNGRR